MLEKVDRYCEREQAGVFSPSGIRPGSGSSLLISPCGFAAHDAILGVMRWSLVFNRISRSICGSFVLPRCPHICPSFEKLGCWILQGGTNFPCLFIDAMVATSACQIFLSSSATGSVPARRGKPHLKTGLKDCECVLDMMSSLVLCRKSSGIDFPRRN